jgi:hypothetical protein
MLMLNAAAISAFVRLNRERMGHASPCSHGLSFFVEIKDSILIAEGCRCCAIFFASSAEVVRTVHVIGAKPVK